MAPIPVDDCALGTHKCDPLAICTDQLEGYTCTCEAGYTDTKGDGTQCLPLLQSLFFAPGALDPPFKATTLSYTLSLGLWVEGVALTPVFAAGSTLLVDDLGVASGLAQPIPVPMTMGT